MKKLVVILAVLCMCATLASAQHKMKPVVYVGGGIGMPLSPSVFSDYWKMGYGFDGAVGVLVAPQIEVLGKFGFNTFPLDADKIISESGATDVTIDGLDFRTMEFGVEANYLFNSNPDNPFIPFLTVGVGGANYKFTDVTVSGQDTSITFPASSYSKTSMFISGGAGINYMFTPKVGGWVSVKYTVITTEGESTSYLPIRAGVKFLLGE